MAAGLGFKTFTTGEVLTAADVNGYLMQGILVFATEAARNAAITSPQEGQFAFTKDNNSLWYYTGSAWAASGATGDIEGVTAGVGISGGGTSGTVTITNSMATAIDAKGDLVPGTGADTFSRLAVGANGTVLTADSAEATGMKWATVSAGAFVGASVYKNTTGQVVGGGASAAVTFNAENFDSDNFHDNSTNNSRLTVPTGKGGKYIVIGRTIWNEYNKGKVGSVIRLNGSTQLAYSVDYTATDYWESHNITSLVDLAAGDYVELVVENGGGGNRTIHDNTNATQATQFQIVKVG